MTEVCREWTQFDGTHVSGKCTNELVPKTGTSDGTTPSGCNICLIPLLVPASSASV